MTDESRPKRSRRIQKRTPEGLARERERKRRWREAHRAECRAAFLRWQKSPHGRAYMREYCAKWRAEHPGYFRKLRLQRRERLGLPPPKPRVKMPPEERRRMIAEWRDRNRDKVREYRRKYMDRIYDSYELHDRYCEARAIARRRRGDVDPSTPYKPQRGRRTPPSWMRRPCEVYMPGGGGLPAEAFARELFRERRKWLVDRNRI